MPATLAIAVLALYLLLGEPLLGRRSHRRMLGAVGAGDAAARLRFYLHWTWQGWLLMFATLAITLGIAGWSPAWLGLRAPEWPHAPALDGGLATGFVIGLVLAASAGFAGMAIVMRTHRGSKGRSAHRLAGVAGNPDVYAMLPGTRSERLGWTALAITAGVTEEVIWRGFALTLLFALLPGVHPALPIALAAAAFGWAHVYQGAAGMLVTGVLGAAFATLFWASGSLLWPVVLHVLIDLRVLLVRAAPPPSPAPGEHA